MTSPSDSERETPLGALRHATLGEYEILAELGRGGMATVYLGHDLALDRKVAIKVLAPALLQMGEGMVERFKREARTAAALSHPHIIPIYAVKESGQVLYFVMQYVAGRSLDSVLREVGPLPIPMVQTIVAHVGDALSYAHRHGVIHRDIKSGNIMLDEEGWAVVTDFGIAKVVEAEGLTLTGVTVGTPTYMSPEQCGTREVTGASDQYSLGVVAYEMLTGRLPFQGESIMAVMYAHFKEQPRPITELRPDCPSKLAAAVMRMLEKDPAQRWPGMDDVVATCGRPALRQDDPIRSQMITLAKAGGRSELLAQLKTPTSPIPPAKPPTRPTTAAARGRWVSGVWWALGGMTIGVALWWAVPRLSQRASPVPVPGRDTVSVALVAPESTAPQLLRPPESVASRAPAQRSPGRERASLLPGGGGAGVRVAPRGRPAGGYVGAIAPRAGTGGDESRGRCRSRARRAREGGYRVPGRGIPRDAGEAVRGDGAARYRGVALGGSRAVVTRAGGSGHAARSRHRPGGSAAPPPGASGG